MEGQDRELMAMTVEEINRMTTRARGLPPSGDQAAVLREGADPWIIRHRDFYYYCTTDDLDTKKKILVSRFERLEDLATAPLVEVFPAGTTGSPAYEEIWAPELQIIDGVPYLYAALYMGNDTSKNGPRERVHCLVGTGTDPQGSYAYKGQLRTEPDRWSIDGTVLELDGSRFFLWSGWDGHENHSQNLYIAKMADPWSLDSDRVCISRPELDWERHGYPYVNEGPQVLQRNGRTFIIYSASGSWTDDYCLGQLTYAGGDPLDPSSWHKESQPVFKKTDTICGVGHCCFVQDHEGHDWLIYHAARSSGAGWARQIRAKRFFWREDGTPDFGSPE